MAASVPNEIYCVKLRFRIRCGMTAWFSDIGSHYFPAGPLPSIPLICRHEQQRRRRHADAISLTSAGRPHASHAPGWPAVTACSLRRLRAVLRSLRNAVERMCNVLHSLRNAVETVRNALQSLRNVLKPLRNVADRLQALAQRFQALAQGFQALTEPFQALAARWRDENVAICCAFSHNQRKPHHRHTLHQQAHWPPAWAWLVHAVAARRRDHQAGMVAQWREEAGRKGTCIERPLIFRSHAAGESAHIPPATPPRTADHQRRRTSSLVRR